MSGVPLLRHSHLRLLLVSAILLGTWVNAIPDREPVGHGAQSSGIDSDLPLERSAFSGQRAFLVLLRDGAHQSATGVGQTIAIIDGGFDLGHEAIDAAAVGDHFDFIDGDTDVSEAKDGIDQDGEDGPDSMFGHGTAVASLIADLAPDAGLLLYRAMDEEGVAPAVNVEQAILRAIGNNATVINISVVFDVDHGGVRHAVEAAAAAGIAIVAPAGNEGGTVAAYPGAYDETICVAGTTLSDELAAGQTNGPDVDIVAPGEELVVALIGSLADYAEAVGSSYASAFAAATAALIREVDPLLDPGQIRSRLRDTAVDIGLDPEDQAAGRCGLRIDMTAAVE
ncbi:MAG: S8 family serine peptidase [Planctomycetota bacterium]